MPAVGDSAALGAIPDLAAALLAADSRAVPATWVPALTTPMQMAAILSPKRIAAFLGQCAVESAGFTTLSENLFYSHADRLVAVFPREFPDVAFAARYVGQPMAIGNHAYANRMGNGDEASGDGFRFRGAGALQLSGRTEIAEFAAAVRRDVNDAAQWLRSPPGAAAGACWYWTKYGLNALADDWRISDITRAINGEAMLAETLRLAASLRVLAALGQSA